MLGKHNTLFWLPGYRRQVPPLSISISPSAHGAPSHSRPMCDHTPSTLVLSVEEGTSLTRLKWRLTNITLKSLSHRQCQSRSNSDCKSRLVSECVHTAIFTIVIMGCPAHEEQVSRWHLINGLCKRGLRGAGSAAALNTVKKAEDFIR